MRSRAARAFIPVLVGAVLGATVGVVGGIAPPVTWPGDVASVAAAVDRTAPSVFTPVEPCRHLDTRLPGVPHRLRAEATLRVDLAGRCGVPVDAVAVAVTVTAVESAAAGFMTVYPAGTARPNASIVNYGPGDVVANHQFVRLGDGGSLAVYTLAASDLLVDVMGYFVPATDGAPSAGRYVPLAQRRLLDTRTTSRPRAGSSIAIDPAVEADVIAVTINVTTTETWEAGFFSAFPVGGRRPVSSILNVSGPAQTRAAGVVVPVSDGGIEVFTSGANHVIVDITGYFTGEAAPQSTDGLFVGVSPERLVDTRNAAGPEGGPRLWDHGGREFDVRGITDGPVGAVALNATVTQTEDSGFLVVHAARTPTPPTSTVNFDRAQRTVANFAVVQLSEHGLNVESVEATHVVVDISGWFTGSPVAGDSAAARNRPPADRRVTIISDSAMAGVRWNGALDGLQGFDAVTNLESCRRLVRPSCRGREGYVPPSAATHIASLPNAGPEELLVVAVGYNDSHESFSVDFDVVVETARRKGFHHIFWVDYRSDVGPRLSGSGDTVSNYAEMNRILGEKLASGRFPDVRRWGFDVYIAGTTGWFHGDGVHETRLGSWGVADWISRHVRAFDDRPCRHPWFAGGSIEDPCPDPDRVRGERGVPNIVGLYPAAAG